MNVVLEDWPSAAAASEFVSVYRNCVVDDQRRRTARFSDVLDQLAQVLFLLRDLDSDRLSSTRMLQELTFAMSGLNSPPEIANDRAEFTSLSGRTVVTISLEATEADHFKARAKFLPLQAPVFEGVTSRQAHKLFARRIDATLERSGGLGSRVGKVRDDFSFEVESEAVRSQLEGLVRLQTIVSRALEAAEVA